MISNTHSGQSDLAPDAAGRDGQSTRPESPSRPFHLRVLLPPLVAGVERVAARPGAVTQPDCRAILSPEIPRTAERRAAPHRQRAAHLLFGSQGCGSSHRDDDVAETARFSTDRMMAVPMWGVGAAIR